jgi:hypothetical protein
MNSFRRINIIAGWVVFLLASVVYLFTIEPTASFWDCGEFIAASYKLEVGHPPGAPFFMIISNFFAQFASEPGQVAKWVNIMSAFSSAFTAAFLFWTITHLASKVTFKGKFITIGQTISVIGAGLIGALAYTVSDTAWFSAVEAEVYATSSLFTAIVFWAILKWENVADEPSANRWIILIAYLMGLSVGVHLLNLLAIPAIVFVYYFKKYQTTRRGIIASLMLSVFILAILLYVMIPGIVQVATLFERVFINGFGLPFNTGLLFYVLILIGLLVYLVHYSHRKRKVILNTIILSVAVFVTGYFSYGIILIRSSANPPMEQNNPETAFALLSYLNREQYGQSPLIRGQYYNAPITGSKNTNKVFTRKDDRYEMTGHNIKLVYDEHFKTIFPRMWSSNPSHITEYNKWGKVQGRPISFTNRNGEPEVRQKPLFTENLRFFVNYQVGHMYLRYFMWNFCGRQNDMQGNGEVHKGNWLSGINFIDEARLGPQDNLPDMLKNNPARNRYFMLPLLLGSIGLLYHYLNHKKDFWIVALLFLFTGLAIVVFLNQYPLQPRERDYAYAASFYAFAIWIGIGGLAIAEFLRSRFRHFIFPLITVLILLAFIPGLMASENWDDHDRSGRYTTRDFAYNYLNSCAPNAILFTNGDNDTFPLWYAQEVEGIRTDVRVLNLSYLSADWYIEQATRKAYDSDPVPFTKDRELYRKGKREIIYLVDRIKDYVDLSEAMQFIWSEDERTKTLGNYTERIDYFPSTKFRIPVDSTRIIETGTLRPERGNKIVEELLWEIGRETLMKNNLMVLDLIDNNDWERPVYFAITVSQDLYMNLENYFQLEGLAYRIVPVLNETVSGQPGSVDTDIMFENMVNTFRWGGVNDESVYLDENIRRMMTNFRNIFGRLALELISQGDSLRAKETLNKCMEVIPHKRVSFGYFMIPVIEAFYQLGDIEGANRYLQTMSDSNEEELRYFFSLDSEFAGGVSYDKQLRMHIMQETVRLTSEYQQDELFQVQQKKFQELMVIYQSNS